MTELNNIEVSHKEGGNDSSVNQPGNFLPCPGDKDALSLRDACLVSFGVCLSFITGTPFMHVVVPGSCSAGQRRISYMCTYRQRDSMQLLYHFLHVQHCLRIGFSLLVIPFFFAFLGRLEGAVQAVVSVAATLPEQSLQRSVCQQPH